MESILDNALWQIVEKDHLDNEGQLNLDEWKSFIDMYSSIFAEDASELARDLFREYLINYKGVKNG